ncbi:hypothetical protein D3C85_1193790 [compost metagenome]
MFMIFQELFKKRKVRDICVACTFHRTLQGAGPSTRLYLVATRLMSTFVFVSNIPLQFGKMVSASNSHSKKLVLFSVYFFCKNTLQDIQSEDKGNKQYIP